MDGDDFAAQNRGVLRGHIDPAHAELFPTFQGRAGGAKGCCAAPIFTRV